MIQLVERRVLAPQPRRQLPQRQEAVPVPVELPPEIIAGLQPLVLRQVRHAKIDHLPGDNNIGSASHSNPSNDKVSRIRSEQPCPPLPTRHSSDLNNEAAKASHAAAEGLQAVAPAAALTFGRFASAASLSFATSNAASASRSCLSSVCSTIVPPRVLAVTQPPADTDHL